MIYWPLYFRTHWSDMLVTILRDIRRLEAA